MGAVSYDPVKPDAGPRAKIVVTLKGPRFHADIAIYNDAGELTWVQELDDPARCLALVRTAVIVIYSMMPRPPAPRPPPDPSPPPPAAPPDAAPARVPTPRASAAPLPLNQPMYQAGLGPMVNVGFTPGWGAGGFLFLARRWTSFSITGEARWLGSVIAVTREAHSRFQFSLRGHFYEIAGGPCFHARPFFGCATFTLGVLNGGGGKRGQVQTKEPWMLGTSLRFGTEAPFGKGFALHGFVEVTGIGTRPRLFNNEGERWKTPTAGASVGLAFVVPVPVPW